MKRAGGSPLFLPVVLPEEMRRLEARAIHEGSSEESFMTEAGRQIASQVAYWIETERLPRKVILLVGVGNNGGDALAAGIFLMQLGIAAEAYALGAPTTQLNRRFRARFVRKKGKIHLLKKQTRIDFDGAGLILDGFLGTGFRGKIEPVMAEAIRQAHASRLCIVAIDIPSGLNGASGVADPNGVIASRTIALGLPKAGFFLRDGWNCTGRLTALDFGLPFSCVEEAKGLFLAPQRAELYRLVPKLLRNRHKYQSGYVIGYSGSSQYPGSAKLSGLAALRTGAGIVRVFSRGSIGDLPYELIGEPWSLNAWKKQMKRAQAAYIGPGLGSDCTAWLRKEVAAIDVPLVVDADALQPNIEYPPGAIFTPHRGEMLRLLELKEDTVEEDLLARCVKFAVRKRGVLVLKGAPTFIFSKGRPPVVIAWGDPALASAGTGDVLTGVIAALLAQGSDPFHAAVLGACLHAIAGEIAADQLGSTGCIASDVIDYLPFAIRDILETTEQSG